MSNQATAPASSFEIELAGTMYKFRFSFKAFERLQREFGTEDFQSTVDRLAQEKIGPGEMVSMLWAGLASFHPEVTRDMVLNMLDELDPDEGMAMLGEMFGTSVKPDNSKGKKSGKKAEPKQSTK